MSEMTLIEINGVKMEVDLRHAKIVHENLRVGSKVKLLEKSGYGGGASVWPGVIVGFEPFPTLPTIIVAYMDTGYSGGLKFAHVNSKSADKWELVPSIDDELPLAKGDVLSRFDREIEKKQAEKDELERQRDFFLRNFNAYFEHFSKA
jgi:hypothetical protein